MHCARLLAASAATNFSSHLHKCPSCLICGSWSTLLMHVLPSTKIYKFSSSSYGWCRLSRHLCRCCSCAQLFKLWEPSPHWYCLNLLFFPARHCEVRQCSCVLVRAFVHAKITTNLTNNTSIVMLKYIPVIKCVDNLYSSQLYIISSFVSFSSLTIQSCGRSFGVSRINLTNI